MHVAVCKITIRIPENQSLKGKRRIVKSLIERIQNKFNVSIMEVENQDQWQIATLGIALVNYDSTQLNRTINFILNHLNENSGQYYLVDHHQEILKGL